MKLAPPANTSNPITQDRSPVDSKGHSLPQSLSIKTRDGRHLELTSSKLDKWFLSLDDKKHPRPQHALLSEGQRLKLLGAYGMKSSEDVILFLKSKAGEAVRKFFNEELAEIAALEESRFIEARDKQIRQHRMLAYLFLGLVYRKKARAQKLNEIIQQQNDATLKHNKKVLDEQPGAEITQEALKEQLSYYNESIKALETTLEYKQIEKQLLDQELLLLAHQWTNIVSRHEIFTKQLASLATFAVEMSHPHVGIEEKKFTINQHLEKMAQNLSALDQQITTHVTQNQNQEASALMHQHTAHLLHTEALQDMLAVLNGEKKLFNLEGEETRSFTEATFILTPSQKIAKDASGNYHLIGVNDNLQDMDETKKSKARTRFDKLQTEILTVPKLVNHHCKLEKELHQQRERHALLRNKDAQDDINLLSNQLRHVQAAKASVTAELSKPSPSFSQAAGLRNSIPKISNNGHAFSYGNLGQDGSLQTLRQTLDSMQRHPNPRQISTFTSGLAALYARIGQEMPGYIKKDINRITPGQPIPLRIMMNLNAQLFRLEFAGIKAKIEPKTAISAAPTPFGTWPPKPKGF
jgi:hypothetical protein